MSSSQMSLLLLALLTLTASTTAIPTIYEILNQFGFPSGIIPDSVTSYSTVPSGAGSLNFTAYLKSPCYVTLTYPFHFDSQISGKINANDITELKGYRAYLAWGWQPVNEIKVNKSSIVFNIGYVDRYMYSSDISLFQEIKTCRDGALSGSDKSNKLTAQVV